MPQSRLAPLNVRAGAGSDRKLGFAQIHRQDAPLAVSLFPKTQPKIQILGACSTYREALAVKTKRFRQIPDREQHLLISIQKNGNTHDEVFE